jgi:hypothetical protein
MKTIELYGQEKHLHRIIFGCLEKKKVENLKSELNIKKQNLNPVLCNALHTNTEYSVYLYVTKTLWLT